MQLREDQKKLVEGVRANLRLGNKTLMVAPTAFGKTTTLSYMISVASQREFSSWFVVHKRQLLRQVIRAFTKAGIDFGVVASGYKLQANKRVQIVMIQSLASRNIPKPDMIVIDEAHRSTAKSYDQIFAIEDCFIIGLSATPQRTDGRGLGDRFDVIVEGPSVAECIKMGLIAPYKYYAPSTVDMKGARKSKGDYITADIEKVFEKSTIVGDSINDYKTLCPGKKMLVFCYSVKHAEDVAARYNAAGIPAAHLSGKMKDAACQDIIDRYETGELLVLTSCDLLLEGIDIPTVQAVDQQRPTDSLIVFGQSIGRGFRLFPGKTHLIIFDRVGNYLRHGLPDTPRNWTLDAKPKRKRDQEKTIPTRRCKECYAVSPGSATHCIDPECGKAFPVEETTVRELAGELKEITAFEKKEKRIEVGKAKTKAELERIAKERGYSRGWVFHQMRVKKIS